jgi:hypothetical protein
MNGWTFAAGAIVFMVAVSSYEALQIRRYKLNRAKGLCAKCGHRFGEDEQRVTSWLRFCHMGKGEEHEFNICRKCWRTEWYLLVFGPPVVAAVIYLLHLFFGILPLKG